MLFFDDEDNISYAHELNPNIFSSWKPDVFAKFVGNCHMTKDDYATTSVNGRWDFTLRC